jgi:hypothetical protein
MIHVLVALIALMSVCGARAADWRLVSSDDNFVLRVDLESLVVVEDRVRAWSKWTFSQPVQAPDANPPYTFQAYVNLVSYRCADRTFADLQTFTYAGLDTRAPIRTSTYPDEVSRYKSAPPDSHGEALLVFVCAQAGRLKR